MHASKFSNSFDGTQVRMRRLFFAELVLVLFRLRLEDDGSGTIDGSNDCPSRHDFS